MDLVFACPNCKAQLKAPERLFGKLIRCPSCKESLAVPKIETNLPPVVPKPTVQKPSPPNSRRPGKAKMQAMLRATAKRELRELQHRDMVDAFPLIKIAPTEDGRCCEYCMSQKGIVIRTRDCTLDMLPPFSQCTNEEDGCRCMFIAMYKSDAANYSGETFP